MVQQYDRLIDVLHAEEDDINSTPPTPHPTPKSKIMVIPDPTFNKTLVKAVLETKGNESRGVMRRIGGLIDTMFWISLGRWIDLEKHNKYKRVLSVICS